MIKRMLASHSPRVLFFAAAAALSLTVSVSIVAKEKTLSKSELRHLIAKAETSAEHEQIARYFDAEAAKLDAEAKEHRDLATLYKESSSSQPTKFPGSMQTYNHCDDLTKSLSKAAEDARAMAAAHRQMAKEAGAVRQRNSRPEK